MRKLNYFILSSALILFACGSSDSKDVDKKEISAENIVIADFAIDGMVCAVGCAKTIEEEIAALSGVAVSEVDYENGKAHFEYDKSQLTEQDIISKIQSLADGQYKVSRWEEKVETNGTDNADALEEVTVNEDKAKVIVNLPSFQIPNLFTFLINQV